MNPIKDIPWDHNMTEQQKQIRRDRAAAWGKANPDRHRRSTKVYQIRHRTEIAATGRFKRRTDPEKFRQKQANWRTAHPWYDSWQGARQRCGNPKHPSYARYGGKGIKCLLTKAEIQFLWVRDNAHLLDAPSIDRINNDGDYTLENCQWISKSHNSRKVYSDAARLRGEPNALARGEKQAENAPMTDLTTPDQT